MPLPSGHRIGPYEVVSALGAGGMGEVYRAKDAKLKREVALKVLPADVANDRERLARFQREAEVLASLNHPHIAHVYGIEENALVMELVDGEDLAERLTRGPMPIDEALPIAKQIAEALEAAHEQGIVHRDLKPANIKVRPDGTVKVLDFGLAKAFETGTGSREPGADLANSPTITSPAMTLHGVILGTAAYMAPEQAKGKRIDRRVDIWAFGAVLYEMLTGRRAFQGEDATDTIAEVLKSSVDWSPLPAGTPPGIRLLLRRCLEKDPRKRAPHISIARLAIEDAEATTSDELVAVRAPRSSSSRWLWAAAAAMLAIAAGATGYWIANRDAGTASSPPMQSLLHLTHNMYPRAPSQRFAISPDGRRLAYAGMPVNGQGADVLLHVRPLEGTEAQALPGTEGAVSPFWSPDSRFIAFFANGDLKRIDAAGGPTITIVRRSGTGGGRFHPGSWNRDDVILYARDETIVRVSARGGDPQPVTSIDKARETGHDLPVFLPDGRHFLYGSFKGNTPAGLFVRSLDGGAGVPLVEGTGQAAYASGFLLFSRGTHLMAQAFDPDRRQLSGEAMAVAENVQSNVAVRIAAAFSVSSAGSIVYQTVATTMGQQELKWFTREGAPAAVAGEPGRFRSLELSPDGQRVATVLLDDGVRGDAWLLHLERGQRTRLTFDAAATGALWSRDGQTVLIDNDNGILLKRADGSGQDRRIETPGAVPSYSWSPDGNRVLFLQTASARGISDVWELTLDGSRKPAPVVATNATERWAQYAPDGRWIAYTSDESGRIEVYLSRGDGSGRWQVSTSGGLYPRWSRNGRELYFVIPGPSVPGPSSQLAAVPITFRNDTAEIGRVTPLFAASIPVGFGRYFFDVAPDGRFLVAVPTEVNRGAELTLLTNWTGLVRTAP